MANFTESRLYDTAILLRAMGESSAAKVLQRLNLAEVERIGEIMSNLPMVSQQQLDHVINQFFRDAKQLTGFVERLTGVNCAGVLMFTVSSD